MHNNGANWGNKGYPLRVGDPEGLQDSSLKESGRGAIHFTENDRVHAGRVEKAKDSGVEMLEEKSRLSNISALDHTHIMCYYVYRRLCNREEVL
jgi:hypothetical protein